MMNDNIRKWAEALIETNVPQALGRLCAVGVDGVAAYCCLGFGSELADVTKSQIKQSYGVVDIGFGRSQTTRLAPVEFVTWLGYVDEDQAWLNAGWTFDVKIDFPDGLRMRPVEDTWDAPSAAFDDHGDELTLTSCADLNDSNVSFRQIGELILFFGLSDRPLVVK